MSAYQKYQQKPASRHSSHAQDSPASPYSNSSYKSTPGPIKKTAIHVSHTSRPSRNIILRSFCKRKWETKKLAAKINRISISTTTLVTSERYKNRLISAVKIAIEQSYPQPRTIRVTHETFRSPK